MSGTGAALAGRCLPRSDHPHAVRPRQISSAFAFRCLANSMCKAVMSKRRHAAWLTFTLAAYALGAGGTPARPRVNGRAASSACCAPCAHALPVARSSQQRARRGRPAERSLSAEREAGSIRSSRGALRLLPASGRLELGLHAPRLAAAPRDAAKRLATSVRSERASPPPRAAQSRRERLATYGLAARQAAALTRHRAATRAVAARSATADCRSRAWLRRACASRRCEPSRAEAAAVAASKPAFETSAETVTLASGATPQHARVRARPEPSSTLAGLFLDNDVALVKVRTAMISSERVLIKAVVFMKDMH